MIGAALIAEIGDVFANRSDELSSAPGDNSVSAQAYAVGRQAI
jgi:hypothetical protein